MSMRWIRACLIVPGIAWLLASCAPYVRSDVNRALIGTVHCHTFAWAGSFHGNSPLRSTVAGPINEARLRTAIAAHLGTEIQPAKGNADCLVGYGIGSSTVLEGGYPYGGGAYWGYPYGGWGYPYGGWGYPYAGWGPYAYPEGVISVYLYEAKSGQPLWHASVSQNLSEATGADAEKRINAAVAAIFKKYPG
jgi:hypothetical protein